jgi:hypothetical protein
MSVVKINVGTAAAPVWVTLGGLPSLNKARLARVAAQSIPNAANTRVVPDTTVYNVGVTVTGGAFIAPRAAYVRVSAYVQFASNTTNRRYLAIQQGGVAVTAQNIWPSSPNPAQATVATDILVAAGDTIELIVLQASTAVLDVVSAFFTYAEFDLA